MRNTGLHGWRHECGGTIVDVVASAVMLLSILLIPLLWRYSVPKTTTWKIVLTAGCWAVLAAGFFFLWHWLGYPVLAYLDAVVYGLGSLTAALVVISEWSRPKDDLPNTQAPGGSLQQKE
jgi:ABC-type branched-subunit amino acid transport system permease subunit